MSRTSLIRPRRHRAVSDRPATRHAPPPQSSFRSQSPPFNPHYKRCPKAQRLRLRSDQSSSRPLPAMEGSRTNHGLPFPRNPCQVRAPLTRRIRLAPSGDAPEHGVMSAPSGHSAPSGLPRPSPCWRVRTVGRAPTQNQRTILGGFHRRHHRRSPVYERRSRVHAPIP